MKNIVLHEFGVRPRQFDKLVDALKFAKEQKVTGYIVVDGEIINLKKGKRPGAKKGTWVVEG